MLGCSSSLFGRSSSDLLKDTFLLYKKVTEQYRNPEILRIARSLVPQDIVYQTTKDDWDIVPLLKWFKSDFMKWTPKDPVCEKCANRSEGDCNNVIYDGDSGGDSSRGCSNNTKSVATLSPLPIMQVKRIIVGNSWKIRKVEVFICNICDYEYVFPRYAEIPKIAETKNGRCSEWSMIFGAILSSLGIETRIVHDFLDHCWNEALLPYQGGTQWVHVDSTLDYPFSLNHPHYYEENWAKEYEYVLAFSADKAEDVTQTYTLRWEAIQNRRLKKKRTNDFPRFIHRYNFDI